MKILNIIFDLGGVIVDLDVSRTLNSFVELSRNGESRDDVVKAWNAMLIGIPQERIHMLEELRKDYRIFILSNTNELHEECFEQMVPGYDKFSSLFEKAYYSHRIGCRKPDRGSFEIVLNDSGIRAEETLFVDDLAVNVSAAKKLNFHTLHILPGMEVSKIIKNHL